MKIIKLDSTYSKNFKYVIEKTYLYHGLLNDNNKFIGYFYKNNEKGFWLDSYKR